MYLNDVILPAFATLFVVIDPIGLVPIFIVLTAGMSVSMRRKVAVHATLVSIGVLLPFALFGEIVLGIFGIGLPAFRIAGGLMLLLIAIEMLFEKRSDRRHHTADSAHITAESGQGDTLKREDGGLIDLAIFPLGVPLMTGPGAITSMILLTGSHSGDIFAQFLTIIVMFIVILSTFVLFLLSHYLDKFTTPGVTNVISRLLGIILSALAVQFIIIGIGETNLL